MSRVSTVHKILNVDDTLYQKIVTQALTLHIRKISWKVTLTKRLFNCWFKVSKLRLCTWVAWCFASLVALSNGIGHHTVTHDSSNLIGRHDSRCILVWSIIRCDDFFHEPKPKRINFLAILVLVLVNHKERPESSCRSILLWKVPCLIFLSEFWYNGTYS